MKATDLMIGDWVKCTDPKCEGHQVDLIDLANEEVGLDGEIDNFENIIPIPLTPEILEKNGFEMHLCDADDGNLRYYECADWNIGWCIDIYPLPNGDYYMEIDSRMDRHMTQTRIYRVISSVHELQHGIKYGEIEKEVVVC